MFPDGLRCGAGAELIIGMHKSRVKLTARVTSHQVTEERPRSAPFWPKVALVQTLSTSLSLQMGVQCWHLDADTWLQEMGVNLVQFRSVTAASLLPSVYYSRFSIRFFLRKFMNLREKRDKHYRRDIGERKIKQIDMT